MGRKRLKYSKTLIKGWAKVLPKEQRALILDYFDLGYKVDWRLIYRAKISGQLSKHVLTRLKKTNPVAPENSRGQALHVRTKELFLDGKTLGDYFGISRNTMNKYIRGFANKTKPPLVSQNEVFDFLDKIEYLSKKYNRHPKKVVENARRIKLVR